MNLPDAYARFTKRHALARFFKRDAGGRFVCTDLLARAEAWAAFKQELIDTGAAAEDQVRAWPMPWTKHTSTR